MVAVERYRRSLARNDCDPVTDVGQISAAVTFLHNPATAAFRIVRIPPNHKLSLECRLRGESGLRDRNEIAAQAQNIK
jgi:hypothetical protein